MRSHKNELNLDQLGNAIRQQRKSLDLTQEQLGQYAGCGALFVHDLEKGKPTVRLNKVKTSEDDLLSLLIASGADCVGDIFVLPMKDILESPSAAVDISKLKELSFKELFKQSISPGGKTDEINIPGDEGLLIQRFDRIPIQATQETLAIHQEDMCQLLNRYPADKYLLSLEIASGFQVCSTPIIEVGKFIRLHAYSYLIANGDLHAKNISVCISPDAERIELTPAYDLLSTLPYGEQRMALKLEGRDDNLKRRTNLIE